MFNAFFFDFFNHLAIFRNQDGWYVLNSACFTNLPAIIIRYSYKTHKDI